MRFMVRFVHRDPGSEEVLSLIPAERDRVRELSAEGTLEALYLAADRSSGWIVMSGSSLEQVEEALASLPLYPHLSIELTAIQE
jgi:muconolactone delta-isomerase